MRRSGPVGGAAGIAAATVGVWLIGALVFFREQWTSGFGTVMGNDGDTRFATYMTEHWFQVFHGRASWLNPHYVYPIKGLLGWSDTYLLYEVFYSPLRLLGADQFLALQITDILLSLVGFTSFVGLVRVAFRTPFLLAWAMGLVFTFSNALWLHSGAYQHSGIYFVPLIALLGVEAWKAAGGGRRARSVVLGAGSAGLAALLLYSTFYVSYFSFLAAAVFVVMLAVLQPGRVWAGTRSALATAWPALTAAVGAFALGLIPFALTYLPARTDAPGTTYGDVIRVYAAQVRDLLDVGRGNILWSSAVHAAFPRINLGMSELNWAATPVLMAAALAGGVLCACWLRAGVTQEPMTARIAVALAASATVAAVIPLHSRLGTPWAVIHNLPGAGAMRAIDRIELVAGFAAVMAVTAAGTEAWRHPTGFRRPLLRVAVVLAVVVIMVEQINTTPSSALVRSHQDRLLSSAGPAPKGCRAFYVVDSKERLLFFQSQIDAMLISQKLGIPTVNGYPSTNPRGWDLSDINSPTYLDAVRSWAEVRGVQSGLCRLDLGTMQWQKGPEVPALRP